MDKLKRLIWITSILLVSLGIISFVLNIVFNYDLNFSWPLVVILMGGIFILMGSMRETVSWADWFYFGGCVLLALGFIFFMNVVTSDWNAWAYAWLLLLAGMGAGILLVNRGGRWSKQVNVIAIGTIIISLASFVLFGALKGGVFIQVMAPLLLIAFGVSLRWLPVEDVLPETMRQRIQERRGLEKEAVSNGNDALIEPLSARELQVLALIDQGLTNREIAERLTVAISTVKTHINNIYGKLGVQTRVQAIKEARSLGLIDK